MFGKRTETYYGHRLLVGPVCMCGVCGKQCDTETGFSLSTPVLHLSVSLPQCSILINLSVTIAK